MVAYRTDINRSILWKGAVLGTIAHAISLIKFPALANEQTWEGKNYSVQNTMGSYGTITFATKNTVGAFFDNHSSRNPFSSKKTYDITEFFVSAPEDTINIAKSETLQYLLQDYNGSVEPIITTAFWSEDDFLTASEPWQFVIENGAHLIRIQTMPIDDGILEWQHQYEFSQPHIMLMLVIFDKKLKHFDKTITLNNSEYKMLISEGTKGIVESREAFEEFGIILPKETSVV